MTLLRAMGPADAEPLGRMHHATWRDTYGGVLPAEYWDRWRVSDAAARWQELLDASAPPGVCRLVAESGGSIEGFVVVGPARDVPGRPAPVRPVELYAIYVARGRLGDGLAQRLLNEALPADQPAELWVWRDNARARAFYRRNGFVADGTQYVDPKIPELPEIRMVREVPVPPLM
jgi:ribosomal protein S18 acetylase RimI-like enzyme